MQDGGSDIVTGMEVLETENGESSARSTLGRMRPRHRKEGRGRTPPLPALGNRLWELWQYIIHGLLSF